MPDNIIDEKLEVLGKCDAIDMQSNLYCKLLPFLEYKFCSTSNRKHYIMLQTITNFWQMN